MRPCLNIKLVISQYAKEVVPFSNHGVTSKTIICKLKEVCHHGLEAMTLKSPFYLLGSLR